MFRIWNRRQITGRQRRVILDRARYRGRRQRGGDGAACTDLVNLIPRTERPGDRSPGTDSAILSSSERC